MLTKIHTKPNKPIDPTADVDIQTYPGTFEHHGPPPLGVTDPGQGGLVGLQDINTPSLVVQRFQFNSSGLKQRLLRIFQTQGGLDDFFWGHQEDQPGSMEKGEEGEVIVMFMVELIIN